MDSRFRACEGIAFLSPVSLSDPGFGTLWLFVTLPVPRSLSLECPELKAKRKLTRLSRYVAIVPG